MWIPTNVSSNIFDKDELSLTYTYSNNEESTIFIKIIERQANNKIIQKLNIEAKQGYGKADITIPLAFKPSDGNDYKVEIELTTKSGKTLDLIRYDVSK